MTRDEFKQKMNGLIGCVASEHQATASETLAELSEGFESVFNENEDNKSKITELTANNENLRRVNTKLFLKVGEIPKGDPTPAPTPEGDPEPEKISFESLFNDKGELK